MSFSNTPQYRRVERRAATPSGSGARNHPGSPTPSTMEDYTQFPSVYANYSPTNREWDFPRVPGQLTNTNRSYHFPNPVYFSSLERRFACEAVNDTGWGRQMLANQSPPSRAAASPQGYPGGDPFKTPPRRRRPEFDVAMYSDIRTPSPEYIVHGGQAVASPASSGRYSHLYMAPYVRGRTSSPTSGTRQAGNSSSSASGSSGYRQSPSQQTSNGTPTQAPREGVHLFCKHAWQESCRCNTPLTPHGWGDYCDRCWRGQCPGPRPPGSERTTTQ
ncbi:hypothetical protein B0T10DRAFT_117228 [Thelonectria olida]|uniref:Uncharacterized protein n=1 Tax=Thelonectria olida TaxID=1576542 RepID=A0A9P9AYF7_9HYPO|nr:hypothetical protein B0T10DRAFT_117228 [Thelonectria olida]